MALPTSSCCRAAPITSCRLVLSSGPTACLYCHFSGTKGHFISFASWMRVLNSLGSGAEKVRVQLRKLQAKKRLLSSQCHDEAPWCPQSPLLPLAFWAELPLWLAGQQPGAVRQGGRPCALQVSWGSRAVRGVPAGSEAFLRHVCAQSQTKARRKYYFPCKMRRQLTPPDGVWGL